MSKQKDFRLVGTSLQTAPNPVKAQTLRQRLSHYPWLALVILLVITVGCAAAPLLTGHDPGQFYLTHLNEAPSQAFYFGTDALGRDLFALIWYGGRISLLIGLGSMLISSALGIIYGTVSGTAPAWLDQAMMRLAELLSSIPVLLILLLLLAFLPQPTAATLAAVIGSVTWMNLARLVRSEVRQLHGHDYIWASRFMGGGFWHILKRHLLPNLLAATMFMIVNNFSQAIMLEATLSFLGLGLPPEILSWGSMLTLANRALLTNSWWVILIPGIFVVTTMLCLTRLGHFYQRRRAYHCSNL